ncbi:SGNH/GDSL hydrolase family protein [soil metagenome]
MKIKFTGIVFLILFTVLASFAQTYDREKIWEADMKRFSEIDRTQTPPDGAVLFVGSSSIRLWQTLRQDFPNLKVINRGFGGSQFEDVNHYFAQIVTPYKPKKIVLYVGENDIDAKQTAENVLEDFKTFVALRDKNLPNTPIVFITLKPSVLRWQMWAEMNKANNLIKEEIKKHKRVQFADLAAKMLSADGKPLPDIYVEDNLHLNAKGYKIWRENLLPFLK